MKLRGFGDVLGYQQSGIKNFKLADPIHHEDLFNLAEKNIRDIEVNIADFKKYNVLLKLFDKADIINQINLNKIN
jgi:ATP-dependent DNA helicase RecG